MIGKIIKIGLCGAALLILVGYSSGSPSSWAGPKESPSKAAWIVYWDLETGGADLTKISHRLEKLSWFAAYFDAQDRLFVPAELTQKRQEAAKGPAMYLTIVNDKINANGSVAVKDLDVLNRLFASDELMERHIEEIIRLALDGGYHGIEVDYERIWRDPTLGLTFTAFTNRLYVEARKNNLKLRIVLEPNAPFDSPYFAAGPEYVVMLYNLHGLHNGPGPKADRAFIQKTVKRMKALPGDKAVALATGGVIWAESRGKKMVTQEEARSLAAKNGAEMKRDRDSQCLVFTYHDQGIKHTVWYADVHTLNFWITAAQEQGEIPISLWRLGGNRDIQLLN